MPPPGALNKRARRLLIIGMLVLVGVSIYRFYYAPPPGPYVGFSGATMGTTWNVKVAGDDLGPESLRKIVAAIDEALDDVVRRMSTWESHSELSRFNASASLLPFEISPPVVEVLAIAEEVSRESGGAFDVTVGPLVEAWGFGKGEPAPSPPSETKLKYLRGRVGYRGLILDKEAATLAKREPGMEVDVSAIAKGYGVDRVAQALDELGHANYLVEVGGELRARGRKNNGQIWRVAIERPSEEIRTLHRALALRDTSMATSGDYRNYYESDGKRISHTIDPRSGRPIDHTLASVSVVHPSATWADAWATALNVLGPKAGYDLAVREGLPAHFIVRSAPAGFESVSTPEFAVLLAKTDSPEAPTRGEPNSPRE